MNDASNTATETATRHYQCRHIFTGGHRCASPCLRHEEFCYYHHTTRKPVAHPQQRRRRRSTFHLPLLEDRSAVLHSIGEVLQRIANNDIDPKRAGLLLYGLQIANTALPKEPKPQPDPRRDSPTEPPPSPGKPDTIEEITLDPIHGLLAPITEILPPQPHLSPIAALIEQMMNNKAYDEPPPKNTTNTPKPETLHTIQATDASATRPAHPSKKPSPQPKPLTTSSSAAYLRATAVPQNQKDLSLGTGPFHSSTPFV